MVLIMVMALASAAERPAMADRTAPAKPTSATAGPEEERIAA
jgi:hypothetical protein